MSASPLSGITLRRVGGAKARLFRATLEGKALVTETWAEGGQPKASRKAFPDEWKAERALWSVAGKKLQEGFTFQRDPRKSKPGELVLALKPPGVAPGRAFDIDPGGRRAFLVAGRGDPKANAAVVDLATGAWERRPIAPDRAGRQLFNHAVLVSADGAKGYYLLNETLREQDLATGAERDLLSFDEERSQLNPFVVQPEMDHARARLLTPSKGGLLVLDAATGKPLCQVKPGTRTAECRAIGLSPSGQTFAAYVASRHLIYGHEDAAADTTNEVRLYRVSDGKLLAAVPRDRKVDRVGVAFDDKGLLVTYEYGEGPFLLDLKGKRLAGKAEGGNAWAYSPDGALLAVGSGTTIQLLDARTHRAKGKLETGCGRIARLLFSGDGRALYAGADGMVLGFRVKPGS